MSQRVHLEQRCHSGNVAEVVLIRSLGESGTCCGFNRYYLGLFAVFDLVFNEGHYHAAEVGAAADAADDDVGVDICLFHLQHGLLSDNGLVQQYMVEHASQRVVGILSHCGVLNGLADGYAQAAGAVGVLLQNCPSGIGFLAGAGYALGSPGLHHYAAIGFLFEAYPDHVNLQLYTEEHAPHGQRAAPLSGAGLGGDSGDAFLLVVVRLCHGGICLVASCRTDTLVFVVDVRRCSQCLFQSIGPN